MSASTLPLEIQQHVFSYLDTRTFHRARNVCRWWRYASLDTITLRKQLKKLPVCPMVQVTQMKPGELQDLFHEAAYTLMLGVSIFRLSDVPDVRSSSVDLGFPDPASVATTTDGTRTVIVRDRKITLLDTTGACPITLYRRPINDLRETVGNGPWLKPTHASTHELALSSSGRLLAIAQERTIQIYDLDAEPDSFTVNEYVSSAAGHYICGLDFEQDDHVLRVRLSGRGTVLYLGTPAEQPGRTVDIDHYKSKAGLRHVLLDTSLLSLDSSAASQDHPAVITGLQLLRPYQNGFLFAAQHHGGEESSHYILGHVRCSSMQDDHAPSVEPCSVTVLVRLESFLSAWQYTVNAARDSGLGLYENMPSAHEHHPGFALSPDGNFLVVAEQDKKAIRHMTYTQIFLYRLPGNTRLMKTLMESNDKEKMIRDAATDISVAAQISKALLKQRVARIPLCLTTLQGKITKLNFEVVAGGQARTLRLEASTTESTRRWLLASMT